MCGTGTRDAGGTPGRQAKIGPTRQAQATPTRRPPWRVTCRSVAQPPPWRRRDFPEAWHPEETQMTEHTEAPSTAPVLQTRPLRTALAAPTVRSTACMSGHWPSFGVRHASLDPSPALFPQDFGSGNGTGSHHCVDEVQVRGAAHRHPIAQVSDRPGLGCGI